MSFTIGGVRFIDPFACLNESLAKLMQNLSDGNDTYVHLHYMMNCVGEHLDSMFNKKYIKYGLPD